MELICGILECISAYEPTFWAEEVYTGVEEVEAREVPKSAPEMELSSIKENGWHLIVILISCVTRIPNFLKCREERLKFDVQHDWRYIIFNERI